MCVVGKDAEIRGGLRIPASFCFGDSICMETLFSCTYVRMKSIANDCAGTGVLRYIYLVRLESFLFKKYDMYGCN